MDLITRTFYSMPIGFVNEAVSLCSMIGDITQVKLYYENPIYHMAEVQTLENIHKIPIEVCELTYFEVKYYADKEAERSFYNYLQPRINTLRDNLKTYNKLVEVAHE